MATTPASRRRRGRRGRRGRRRRRRRLRRGRRRRQGTVPRRGLAAKPGPTAAATVDVGAGPAMHAASAPAAAGNIVVVVPALKGQSRAATCRRRGDRGRRRERKRRSGQEHWQPLRRAGNAADGGSRFRAGLACGVRVVGLVHDDCFCRIATNIAVLVDGPGAGTKVDDLRQLARHAGLRVAPAGEKWPEPFPSSNRQPRGVALDGVDLRTCADWQRSPDPMEGKHP